MGIFRKQVMKVVRWLRNLRLYQKILVFSLIVVLIAVLVSGIVYYRYTAAQIVDTFTVSARDLTQQTSTALTAQVNNVVQRSNAMLTNRSFSLTMVDYLTNPDDKNYTRALGTIANFLSEMVTNEQIVDSAFIHTSKADFDDFSRIRNHSFTFDDSSFATAYASPSAKPLQWLPLQRDSFFTRDNNVIPFVWRFSLAELTGEYAFLVVQLNPDQLQTTVLGDYQSVDDVFVLSADGSFLMGNERDFLEARSLFPDDLLHAEGEWEMDIRTDRGEYIAMHETLAVNGWRIVLMKNKTELLSSLASLRQLILGTALILLLVSGVLIVLLTRSTTRSIRNLALRMNAVRKGDLTARFVYPYRDEVGELADSFNYMVDEIERLMENQQRSIEELRRERNLTSEVQKQKRKAELKALQAQINPHFLYNTLNAITWQAVADGDEKISQLSTALGRFFRLSLSGGSETVTLRDELDHVRNYLLIQQIRYGEKLNYQIQADDALLDVPIIKLILQPLVENAIYHGIKLREGPGLITVTVKAGQDEAFGEMMIFTVADNGAGIEADKLAQMNEALRRGVSRQNDGYGIYNVNERLQLVYGPTCGLRYESTRGEGTTVSFMLPRAAKGDGGEHVQDFDRG